MNENSAVHKRNSHSAKLPKKPTKKYSYAYRLRFTHVLKDSHPFTSEERHKLSAMPEAEQEWRKAFFNSLIHAGLLPELQALSLEELRRFIFMDEGEQTNWRDKLTEQKAQAGQQPLARQYNQGKDNFVSMEVRMLPEVREYVDALAAHEGKLAQKFVEYLICEAINKDPDQVKQGQKLLDEHGGSLVRATRHAQEEKNHAQEQELARLRAALSAGSSQSR